MPHPYSKSFSVSPVFSGLKLKPYKNLKDLHELAFSILSLLPPLAQTTLHFSFLECTVSPTAFHIYSSFCPTVASAPCHPPLLQPILSPEMSLPLHTSDLSSEIPIPQVLYQCPISCICVMSLRTGFQYCLVL